jgi:hypothetical protein
VQPIWQLSAKGRISPLPREPTFSHYLRDLRVPRRLSAAEVAGQVGVSTASIYFWQACAVLKLPTTATREMGDRVNAMGVRSRQHVGVIGPAQARATQANSHLRVQRTNAALKPRHSKLLISSLDAWLHQ